AEAEEQAGEGALRRRSRQEDVGGRLTRTASGWAGFAVKGRTPATAWTSSATHAGRSSSGARRARATNRQPGTPRVRRCRYHPTARTGIILGGGGGRETGRISATSFQPGPCGGIIRTVEFGCGDRRAQTQGGGLQ